MRKTYQKSRFAKATAIDKNDNKYHFAFVLIFLTFEYLRIQESFLPFLAPFKFPLLSTLVLLYFLVKRKKSFFLKEATSKLMILFLIEIVIWVPFAKNNFHAFRIAENMTLTFITVFSIILAVNNIKNLKILIRTWILIQTLSAVWVITHGGKGPGGFVKDENDICAMLVMALPFSFYMAMENRGRFKIWFLYSLSLLIIIIAIIMTSSRGGFLGLIAAILIMVWLSEKRLRNVVILLAISFSFAGAMVSFLPDSYVNEMKTISDKGDGTRNLRFLHWTTAIEIYKDNPVFGVGASNYPWHSGDYFYLSSYFVEGARIRSGRVSHSLYFTLIPELGTVGIILFFFIILKPVRKLSEIIKSNHLVLEARYIKNLAKAMLASMGGFLVSAAFISVLYYPMLWHLIGFVLILDKIYRSLLRTAPS